jgi:hypothetical protein
MSDKDGVQTAEGCPGPRPTDFLAFSREFARQSGLDPDLSTWRNEDLQVFLDWWLLRTGDAFSAQ